MTTISLKLLADDSPISNKDKYQIRQMFSIFNEILQSSYPNLSFETDLKLSKNVCEILSKNGFEVISSNSKTEISFRNCSVDIDELRNLNCLDIDESTFSNMCLAKFLKYAVLQKQFANIIHYLFNSYKLNYDGFTKVPFRFHIENEVLDLLKLESFHYTLTPDNNCTFDMTHVVATQEDYDLYVNNKTIALGKNFKLLLLKNQYNYIINFLNNNPSNPIIGDIHLYEELKNYLIMEHSFSIQEIETNVYYFKAASFAILPLA